MIKEDPYVSMEKDQLISMIHFLVKREDERAQENQELKDMVKDLRDTHKQDVKTQTNLLKSIDRLTNQVADLTTQNKTLQQKVNDLLSQISVGNKVRFGSKSQKGIRKSAAPVQDREKDKDNFDGTNGAVMSSTPQQIQQERQGEQTTKIIQRIRQRLDKLLADTSGMRGDLMNKALNYLKSFWNQLILYLKDGRYCIDRSALPLGSSKNSLAERTLRPMTVERKRSSSAGLLPTGRKNSLTFGSHDGAEVSVIYHTFIETCKMCGVSTLEYFKEFFKAAIKREQFRMYSRNVERELAQVNLKAIMQGRTDYENMLPMTIGIKK